MADHFDFQGYWNPIALARNQTGELGEPEGGEGGGWLVTPRSEAQ